MGCWGLSSNEQASPGAKGASSSLLSRQTLHEWALFTSSGAAAGSKLQARPGSSSRWEEEERLVSWPDTVTCQAGTHTGLASGKDLVIPESLGLGREDHETWYQCLNETQNVGTRSPPHFYECSPLASFLRLQPCSTPQGPCRGPGEHQ